MLSCERLLYKSKTSLSSSFNIDEKNSGINNGILLISLLMNYYDISINDVITHQDVSGKYCPHDIFDRYSIKQFYEDLAKLT